MCNQSTLPPPGQLQDVVESVWSGLLGIPLAPGGDPAALGECLAAEVAISGRWNGKVTVFCSRRVALRAASIMFRQPPERIDDALLADALSELVNIIGGNIKALLPAPSRLSLPRLVPALAPPREGLLVMTTLGEPVCLHVEEAPAQAQSA